LSKRDAGGIPYTASHDNPLEPTATHWNTLQHIATHCNSPQRTDTGRSPHTATRCNPLQPTETRCNTLQHTAPHCTTLHQSIPHCNTLRHIATHCNTLQYTATHCNRPGGPRKRSRSRSRSPLTPRGGGSRAGERGSLDERAPVSGSVFFMKTARAPRPNRHDWECKECGNLVYGHKAMCGWSLVFCFFLSCYECPRDCSTLQHTTAHCNSKKLPCVSVCYSAV